MFGFFKDLTLAGSVSCNPGKVASIFLYFLLVYFYPAAANECSSKLNTADNQHELENLNTSLKNTGEIKASDLEWNSHTKIPKEISRYMKKRYLGINQFSLIDLNKDGKDEIIIRSTSLGGSGGEGFVFFEKQNNDWKEIINFTGGFILSHLDIPQAFNSRYYTITQWRRYGGSDTRQSLLAYKNHKYHFVSEQPIPLTVLYSKDFQKMILDINWTCWAAWN
jgi:hypothetical protein